MTDYSTSCVDSKQLGAGIRYASILGMHISYLVVLVGIVTGIGEFLPPTQSYCSLTQSAHNAITMLRIKHVLSAAAKTLLWQVLVRAWYHPRNYDRDRVVGRGSLVAMNHG